MNCLKFSDNCCSCAKKCVKTIETHVKENKIFDDDPKEDEANIRKTLKNYYLNPFLKCTKKWEYPYSNFLQLFVIVCISIQVRKIHDHVIYECGNYSIDMLYYNYI